MMASGELFGLCEGRCSSEFVTQVLAEVFTTDAGNGKSQSAYGGAPTQQEKTREIWKKAR
jgi:hypothetical protein